MPLIDNDILPDDWLEVCLVEHDVLIRGDENIELFSFKL